MGPRVERSLQNSFFDKILQILATSNHELRPSWLVDGNRFATKIKSASGTSDPERVKWKSNPSKACPNCHFVIDNTDVSFLLSSASYLISFILKRNHDSLNLLVILM
ncbi:hypothetical protein Patl1_16505 [Pistacia atlantica]|uniref:Uncharacterized protein n=1 Tax=Pistacia atlantica TaxID=434234 RepID=A0ACC1B9S4_9ROSI|nr:hypothetical protein Patl1_16505 [Pistacia atlantica]